MHSLLYVEVSPRKDRSASIEVARAFLNALKRERPALRVDFMDLWSTPLPEFDGSALEAKYAGLSGTPLTEGQEAAWNGIRALGERFKAADLLLFAVPLWNWSLPYKLKHLIDVVSQKDILFSFDERGFSGLLAGRRAVCVYARGLDYGADGITPAARYDFQRPYLEMWLRFVGVSAIDAVHVEKTLMGKETDRHAREEACGRAVRLAQRLARDGGA